MEARRKKNNLEKPCWGWVIVYYSQAKMEERDTRKETLEKWRRRVAKNKTG